MVKRFVKRVTFRANGIKSYSTVLATDAEYEWDTLLKVLSYWFQHRQNALLRVYAPLLLMTFAGNYQGPLYAPHPDIKK